MNRFVIFFRSSKIAERSLQQYLGVEKKIFLYVPVQRNIRNYSQQNVKIQDPKSKLKIRRMYALGGCLIFMWISTHGLLLYRRRSEHRELDDKLPPIAWNEFVEKYIVTGKVKSIVYQPQFGTANVYLHSDTEQKMKKTVADMFHISPPDKFSRPPDVRFFFDEDQKDVEKAIKEAQKQASNEGHPMKEIEFSIDQFPSYRELSFIILSTLFTVAVITAAK